MNKELVLILLRRDSGSGAFELVFGGAVFALIAAWTLWERVYARKWHEYRSRNWTRVEGQFDEGEVIAMRRARSQTISGYEVWLGYDYHAEGEQNGLYRVSEGRKHEADAALTALAHKRIVVRVNPRNPKRSFVSENDFEGLDAGRG